MILIFWKLLDNIWMYVKWMNLIEINIINIINVIIIMIRNNKYDKNIINLILVIELVFCKK